MPSLDEVFKFRQERFEASMALIKLKGHDYNKAQQDSGDTLFNLKVCEILGIVPSTEEGILVRLSDKLMRLISLTKPGREAAVKDESVLDTVNDIHNYVDYLALIWQQRRQPNKAVNTNEAFEAMKRKIEEDMAKQIGSGNPPRIYRRDRDIEEIPMKKEIKSDIDYSIPRELR